MKKNSSSSTLTLEEILSHSDEIFLDVAYQVILNRQPDLEGKKYYLKRLRSNVSKIEILSQLRNSTEGKSRQIDLAGLDEVILRHKKLKTPLLGSLLRLVAPNKMDQVLRPSLKRTEEVKRIQFLNLLSANGINEGNIPLNLTIKKFNDLNPGEHFDDLDQAFFALLNNPPLRKLRIYAEDKKNADFYTLLAIQLEKKDKIADASELYKLSLLFADNAVAHEHLGNMQLRANRNSQAIFHYRAALNLKSRSHWVYSNLSRAQAACGNYEQSIDTLRDGLIVHPGSDLLMSHVDERINDYWSIKDQKIDFLATCQNRGDLINEYESVTGFIADSYTKIFTRCSGKLVAGKLNPKRVLIIGLTQGDAPQCFRYRVEQKLEQLRCAGYESETVAWHDQVLAMSKINFYDLIVFYRVPAFPGVLKMVAYAKSLGKITFFEVDDLLFEQQSVPAFETYGGQISMAAYTNVTKDIGSYRSMAKQCHYAIASTLPLIKKLSDLVITGTGYLHRNGLDKYNRLVQNVGENKGYINLFYGSGTLAHNSDFILEALPAITRVLREHGNVKLTVVGFLTLPLPFLREFEDQVIQVPLVKNISAYWEYLSVSDINLAVLHDDELTACKSEIKWLEAATFSIPSIVSRTENYTDVINHGVDGFVVHGEDNWYSALKELVINPDVRHGVGVRAFLRAKSEYSVAELSNNIDRIMKSAVEHHSFQLDNNQAELNEVIAS